MCSYWYQVLVPEVVQDAKYGPYTECWWDEDAEAKAEAVFPGISDLNWRPYGKHDEPIAAARKLAELLPEYADRIEVQGVEWCGGNQWREELVEWRATDVPA